MTAAQDIWPFKET